jgi:hypothetical protein
MSLAQSSRRRGADFVTSSSRSAAKLKQAATPQFGRLGIAPLSRPSNRTGQSSFCNRDADSAAFFEGFLHRYLIAVA